MALPEVDYPFQIRSFEEYQMAYAKSVEQPEDFWEAIAKNFQWTKQWSKILNWNFSEPKIEWFQGAQLNITENCLDRHLEKKGNQPALIWEPNNPQEASRTLSYSQLFEQVCLFAQVLQNSGVKKGDRVCIYMGMIPELTIAILGCARLGAIHSVIFGGFSAQSIADRVKDAHATFIITCDGAFRGQKDIPLKSIIDEALIDIDWVKKIIVYARTKKSVSMQSGRDSWWDDEMKAAEEQMKKKVLSLLPQP